MNRSQENGGYWRSVLHHDLLASVVVFLVALPLCMGIAIASGVPVAAGLITGIVGGLLVGLLAGAPLQVSGPAAGLTVVVYGIVQQHGLEALGIIVLGAGLLQVAAGLLGLGQWFRAVSPAVIKGMLAGIGLLIVASQFHVMVDDKPKESGLRNLLTIPQAIAKGIGMPEWTTSEERELRTQLLKDVGALHVRQTELRDSVATGETGGATAASAETIGRQEQVVAGLREVIAQMERAGTGEQAARAAAVALADSEAALADLQSASESRAETQQAAAESLERLSAKLKDHAWAAKVGLLTIGVLIVWQGFIPRRLKLIPGPLVAVCVATLVALVGSLPVVYVEVPDSLLDSIRLPAWGLLGGTTAWGLVQSAIVVALIASAETLLCATAVDQMHGGKRTNYDRELFAQGVGNSVCGLLGALPMTGVIVRSAANVQAGAKSRMSAVMHGAWLLTFVALLPFVLRSIPVASLAAVLVYTGYKLINLKQLKELGKYGWGEVGIFWATFIGIVVTDLLIGVMLGVALSAAKLLYTFSHLDVRLDVDEASRRSRLSLEGAATFLRLPRLAATLERVPANAELHVDLERLNYIDHACLDLLMNWARQHESSGGWLVIDWDSLHGQFRQDLLARQKSVA